MMPPLTIARYGTLIGYYGLLLLLLNWHSWIAPPAEIPRAAVLIILLLPLLLPMRGLVHGRKRTHEWAHYLALLYFALGVDTAYYHADVRLLAYGQILFSSMLFFGCIYYVRYQNKLGR